MIKQFQIQDRYKRFFRQKNNTLIFIILFLAFLVRVWGINFGVPDLRPHTDESLIVSKSEEILKTGDLNPHFFSYPSLIFYLEVFLLAIVKPISIFLMKLGVPLSSYWADAYFLGRLIIAIFGAASVWLVYRIGDKLFSRKVALVSAFFFSFSFAHIQSSHYLKADVPMFFLGLVSFYFSLKILEEQTYKNYLLSGLFAGLATSTQYTGFVFFIPLITSHLVSFRKFTFQILIKRFFTKKLMMAILVGILAFFIITPYALFSPSEFRDGVVFSTQGSVHGPTMSAKNNISSWLWYPEYLFYSGFSFPLFVAFLVGFLFFLKKIDRKRVILLVFFLSYCLLIGINSYRSDRLSIPLLLPLTLFAGFCVVRLAKIVTERIFRKRYFFGSVILGLSLLASSLAVFRSFSFDYLISQKDTRELAAEWVEKNYPKDQLFFTIGDTLNIGHYLQNDGYSNIIWYPLENKDIFLYSGEILLVDSVNYHSAYNYQKLENFKKFLENYQLIEGEGKLIKEFSQPLFKTGFFSPFFLEHSSTVNVYHNPTVQIFEIPKISQEKYFFKREYFAQDMVKFSSMELVSDKDAVSKQALLAFYPKGGIITGPYEAFPRGKYKTTYRLKTDDNGTNNKVAAFGITSSGGGKIFAQRIIQERDFPKTGQYYDFELQFFLEKATKIETIVLYQGKNKLWVENIKVERLDDNQN